MIDALYIAESALAAQQTRLDSISNNLANLNTNGFKKSRVEFSALVRSDDGAATSGSSPTAASPGMVLNGVAVDGVRPEFQQGVLKLSNHPLDVALLGDGFIEIETGNGERRLSRGGRLIVDREGYLAVKQDYRLSSLINVPPGAEDIEIEVGGTVTVLLDTGQRVEIGEIEVVLPQNAADVEPVMDGMYEIDGDAELLRGRPGEMGLAELRQGYVEQSNVSLTEEMVDLIVAQRGYQLNARVVQLADQLLETINNLRR